MITMLWPWQFKQNANDLTKKKAIYDLNRMTERDGQQNIARKQIDKKKLSDNSHILSFTVQRKMRKLNHK